MMALPEHRGEPVARCSCPWDRGLVRKERGFEFVADTALEISGVSRPAHALGGSPAGAHVDVSLRSSTLDEVRVFRSFLWSIMDMSIAVRTRPITSARAQCYAFVVSLINGDDQCG